MIEKFENHKPDIADNVFIHEKSVIIGKVEIKNEVSVWPGVVIRGDVNSIYIGNKVNVQDNTCIHVAGEYPTIIEDNVTIGHSTVIHACKIKKGCLIGMGATILDGAEIGKYSIIGANSLVTKNKKIPPKSLVMGSPAKVVRKLKEDEVDGLIEHAKHYWDLAKKYKR